jgi:hypothetical protein
MSAVAEFEGEAHELEHEHGEHELATTVLELQEATELEGFLPLLLGPIMSGLRALAPVVVKAAVPVLKQVGARALPNLGGGKQSRRQRGAGRELEAELEMELEAEGFLPLIGSVVSGLMGGELEVQEHEIARRYVRLARLSGRRAAAQIMAILRTGEPPTATAIRRVVTRAVRSAAETLFGEPSAGDPAQELLEIHEVHELESFLGSLLGPLVKGIGKAAPSLLKAAMPMLQGVATKVLPALGGDGGGASPEMEAFLGSIVGGLLGGELEHEHGAPDDLARATWFIRLASAAARRAAGDVTSMLDRGEQPTWTTLRQIFANSLFTTARRHGDGDYPEGSSSRYGGRPSPRSTGRWERQGHDVVILLG